ncbi:hypothetical protein TNIN_236041 [Trichonephila inaurata madagascariensis]|uniref:Secreted protein n=1 Tax=Trichonephila inaurata madagascariensis TaxID=2747483 RepID=A0A8X6Y1H6_9ARAC|nr:hypothetical protein TNIN_236021 [Trichonephila inaurata madagascariensis]GFY62896.1 hypothetical protein TNIN_236041 [Trichonephila inaurata madagascariensis]
MQPCLFLLDLVAAASPSPAVRHKSPQSDRLVRLPQQRLPPDPPEWRIRQPFLLPAQPRVEPGPSCSEERRLNPGTGSAFAISSGPALALPSS